MLAIQLRLFYPGFNYSFFLVRRAHHEYSKAIIRTPLNGIIGMSELLKQSTLNKRQQHYNNTISSSSDALLHIINDILDYSKLKAQQSKLIHKPFLIDEVLARSTYLFHNGTNTEAVKLFCYVSPELPREFIGDAHRLQQILINLIGNAFKFTEKGYLHPRKKTHPDC